MARGRDRPRFRNRLQLKCICAPDDYQQGATVKIMFIHVPAAWLAMFGWTAMTIAALGTLVWRHPLADVAGKAAGADRGCLHLPLPRHRIAVGPADVGDAIGFGTRG